jgi:hypothetical protein
MLASEVTNLFTQSAMSRLPGFTANATGSGFVEFAADGTYHFTADYQVTIALNSMSGEGAWSGTLDGTWSVEGSTLTMAQTNNALSGSVNVMGTSTPMPSNRTFSGTATLVDCQPETLKYSIETPMGTVTNTLVHAG